MYLLFIARTRAREYILSVCCRCISVYVFVRVCTCVLIIMSVDLCNHITLAVCVSHTDITI